MKPNGGNVVRTGTLVYLYVIFITAENFISAFNVIER